MLFHKQKHLSTEAPFKGSCYPTVIACLLDLPLDHVPHFNLFYYTKEENETLERFFYKKYIGTQPYAEAEEYRKDNYRRFLSLAQNHWSNTLDFFLASKGYMIQYIPVDTYEDWLFENTDVEYMVTGKSLRGIDHIVVYKNGLLFHDPHPSGDGLTTLHDNPYEILTKLV